MAKARTLTPAIPARRRRALFAAGVRIRLDDERTIKAYRQRTQGWQQRAWLYHKEIPELGFTHRYVRDALSKVRIFAGIRPEPDEDPQAIEDGALAEQCERLLARLEPHSELMGGVAINLDIPGDVSVAIIPDDDEPTGERCRVLSIDELKTKSGKWFLYDDESESSARELDPDSYVFRLWTPDARFSNRPTSAMEQLDIIGRELLILTRLVEGVANARLAVSGLLGIPDELSLASATEDDYASTEDAGDGEGMEDPFIRDFITAASAAISDPTSAAAALPLIIRGPAEYIEKIKFVDLARPFDPVAAGQRSELLGRIANGADLPREVILGVGGTNHWNAEQIDDQTWRVHLEPRAQRQCAGITAGYLRPMLLAEGVDLAVARTVEVWYDPASLFAQPDPAANAEEGYDRKLVSGAAWRRVRGWDESDAPDDAEIAAREAHEVAMKPAPSGASAVDADAAVRPGPVVAGGRRRPLTHGRLGHRLVAIERDVRTRLQGEANAALLRALERAGMKVRNVVARGSKNRALAAQIADIPARTIPAVLGRTTVAALGLADDEILDAAFGDLEPRYRKLVTRAQHAAIDAAARETQRTVDEAARDEWDRDQDEERGAGWVLLAAGLTALAHDQLFSPAPIPPPVGEFDDTLTVPPGLVRASLDRAGGSPVAQDARGPAAVESASPGPGGAPGGGGATAGPDVLALFRAQLGIIADTYEWVYGDTPRTREFEPHSLLDGATFSSWDDDVLLNPDPSFPDVSHYQPGDHRGCACDFAVVFTQAAEE